MRTAIRVEEVFVTSGVPAYTFVRPVGFDRLKVALRNVGRPVVVVGPPGAGKRTAVVKALDEIGRDVADVHVTIAPLGRQPSTADADTFHIGPQPAPLVAEVVRLGCAALGVRISAADRIIAAAAGSFRLAQLLCLEACVLAGRLDSADGPSDVDVPFDAIVRAAVDRLAPRFDPVLRRYARGPRFHRHGRAPFVHLLRWLAESPDCAISVREEMRRHPSERPSVGNALARGQLAGDETMRFDPDLETITVDDPLLAFYLRHQDRERFERSVGFPMVDHTEPYDVAISFAGEDRAFAELLAGELEELGHTVFYDLSEQHTILARNVEDYLRPIYDAGSRYVVVILGEHYGTKRWTAFEASSYRHRIPDGQVIPVRSNAMPTEPGGLAWDIGGLVYNPKLRLRPQAAHIAEVIARRLAA